MTAKMTNWTSCDDEEENNREKDRGERIRFSDLLTQEQERTWDSQ